MMMSDGEAVIMELNCYMIITAMRKAKLKEYDAEIEGYSVRVKQTALQCKGIVTRVYGFDRVEERQCRRKALFNGFCFAHTSNKVVENE